MTGMTVMTKMTKMIKTTKMTKMTRFDEGVKKANDFFFILVASKNLII